MTGGHSPAIAVTIYSHPSYNWRSRLRFQYPTYGVTVTSIILEEQILWCSLLPTNVILIAIEVLCAKNCWARGRSPRPSGDVCAEPLRFEFLWKPEAFSPRGLGSPKTERVWGVASVARSGPGELPPLLLVIYFFSGKTRVCITPIKSAPSENNRLFGGRTAARNRASRRIIHTFTTVYLRPSFLSCLLMSPAGHLFCVFVDYLNHIHNVWPILGHASAIIFLPCRPQYRNLENISRGFLFLRALSSRIGFNAPRPSFPLLTSPWTRAGAERDKREVGTILDFGWRARAFLWILTGGVVVRRYKGVPL